MLRVRAGDRSHISTPSSSSERRSPAARSRRDRRTGRRRHWCVRVSPKGAEDERLGGAAGGGGRSLVGRPIAAGRGHCAGAGMRVRVSGSPTRTGRSTRTTRRRSCSRPARASRRPSRHHRGRDDHRHGDVASHWRADRRRRGPRDADHPRGWPGRLRGHHRRGRSVRDRGRPARQGLVSVRYLACAVRREAALRARLARRRDLPAAGRAAGARERRERRCELPAASVRSARDHARRAVRRPHDRRPLPEVGAGRAVAAASRSRSSSGGHRPRRSSTGCRRPASTSCSAARTGTSGSTASATRPT